jgi:DedD protein
MTDAELADIKTRSRHRLIGTIVLVLVLVIVVPVLLDRQAPLSESVPSVARSESEPVETNKLPRLPPVDLNAPAANDPVPNSIASASSFPEGKEEAKTSVTSGPLALSPTAITPIEAKPEAKPPVISPPSVIPPIHDSVAPGTRTSAVPEPRAKITDRSSVPAAKKEEQSLQVNKSENMNGWFVQLGVFAEEERAHALNDRMQQRGVRLQMDTIQGPRGTFTRLRAGPFAERDAASAVLARIKALGENAILVHQ